MKYINASVLNEFNIGDYVIRSYEQIESVKQDVEAIVNEVRENGDAAVIKFTEKFDGVKMKKEELVVSSEEINEAYKNIDSELVDSLKFAIKNIKKFHENQLNIVKDSWAVKIDKGITAGQIYRPIEKIGVYIPGGRAIYPSTVLMAVCPAKVAGVREIIMCTPPNENKKISPAILIAANECGVDKIFKIGGAQAIAAMAFGTDTVKSVYKIYGPGNKWVNAAKKIVSNQVAIDNPAGPSEILIIADESANYEYVILDLISQVEHDPENVGIVVSDSESLIKKIQENIEDFIGRSERKDIIRKALEEKGLIIKAKDIEQCAEVCNLIAPEHLEILTNNPKEILSTIKNAGAIFLGENTPVPLGDYSAGTNHILPTGGTAKMYSGLNIFEYIKIIDVLECSKEGLKKLAKSTGIIAEFEGLYGHKSAVDYRLKNDDN